MSKNERNGLIVLALLWLFWKRPVEGGSVSMCWVNPDTGECLPVDEVIEQE